MRRANAQLDTVDGAPDASGTVVNVVTDARTWGLVLADAGLAPTENLAGEPIDPFTGLPAGGDLLGDLLSDPDAFATMRCETSRGTPLHPHDVLRAALAGHVRRVVVDARSVPIDMGRRQRLFTGAARDAAKLLVRRCDHAGCDLPTDFCDVDHVVEWSDNGPTDQANAGIECGHHNRLKHRRRSTTRLDLHGRRYTIRPDGSIILSVGARPPTFASEPDDEDEPVRCSGGNRDRGVDTSGPRPRSPPSANRMNGLDRPSERERFRNRPTMTGTRRPCAPGSRTRAPPRG